MPNGNKGEWSELYAFLKVLITGEISEEDGSMYTVEKMSRFECGAEKNYTWEDGNIIVHSLLDQKVDTALLNLLLPDMFNEIKSGKGSYSCPVMEKVMQLLNIERIKSASSNKDDFKIKFKNSKLRGYNVKSKIGHSAGIINASRRTNFVFEVDCPLSNAELNRLGGPKKIVKAIYAAGGSLTFRKCPESYALQLGTDATEMLAIMLIEYFRADEKSVSGLIDQLFAGNKRVLNKPKIIWRNKITDVLLNSNEYQRPGKICKRDSSSASGGLIYVEQDGSVSCNIYSSKDDAGDYLYDTAFLDTASTGRHEFGKLYNDPDENYRAIKLNLNVKGTH